jgi:hypothetical protein
LSVTLAGTILNTAAAPAVSTLSCSSVVKLSITGKLFVPLLTWTLPFFSCV